MMFEKRCKIGLLVYCVAALCLFFALAFKNQIRMGDIGSLGQWIILAALFGPYLFLMAMAIWPKQKTTGQCVILLVAATATLFLDVLKSSILLESDMNAMEVFAFIVSGKIQLIIMLVALVSIFLFFRKGESDKILE